MKIHDISQEVFSCAVYPGDPAPQREILASTASGGLYNLSAFSMCAHNGTHLDAPFHFLSEGKTVDELALETFIGMAFVAMQEGELSAADAQAILQKARAHGDDAAKRILIKGRAVVSLEAAECFAAAGVLLVGSESQSVGPEEAPMAVHKALLGTGAVLLEGIRLDAVPEGKYLLNAAPLKLAGADGAPCRALLIEL